MYIPDESYYGTLGKIIDFDALNNKPSKPEVVYQNISKDTYHGHCSRASLWGYGACKGKMINAMCNVGVEDLPALRRECVDYHGCTEGCIIGNKFRLSVDASAVTCQMIDIFKNYGLKPKAKKYKLIS